MPLQLSSYFYLTIQIKNKNNMATHQITIAKASMRREAMSKGVKVTYNEDGTVSIELHIIVENGVNIATVCRSIMGEVKYVVTKNTGVEVREVNVFVDSITV